MTDAADLARNRRATLALPGGAHDRLIRRLAIGLPVTIGIIVAILFLTPLLSRGEVSFLLNRKKVQTTSERLRIETASYRGVDDKGQAFELKAGQASQPSAQVPSVLLNNISVDMQMTDGPAILTAPNGTYDFKQGQVFVPGAVLFKAADGYAMSTSKVSIDLKGQTMDGQGGVSGVIPAGEFSANRISADLDQRVLRLEGRARLRMVPGQFRMPK